MNTLVNNGCLYVHSYLGDMSGVGTIRIMIPHMLLTSYKHKNINFCATYLPFFVSEISFYKNISIVQFQRSATEEHLKIIEYFKKNIQSKKYTPIVYEIDDLLTNIPKWNIAHEYYKNNINFIEKIMSSVDGMVVSTEPLKEIYSKYNSNINVIPNRMPKFLWGNPNPVKETDKIRIFWGGSSSHFTQKSLMDKGINGGDFDKNIIDFIIKTRKIYQWVFFGNMPTELIQYKNDIEHHKWVSTLEYPFKMKELNIDIGIAPLDDNIFNKCKSNLKMLEYICAGFPGVYSNVYPYQNAHLTSNNGEEMISHIEKLANDVDFRQKVWNIDRKTIGNDLYWEDSKNLAYYINSYLNLFNLRLP